MEWCRFVTYLSNDPRTIITKADQGNTTITHIVHFLFCFSM